MTKNWDSEDYAECEPFLTFYFQKETFAGHTPSLLPQDVYEYVRAEKEKSKKEAESSAYERVIGVLEGMKYSDGPESLWNVALSAAILKIKELQGKI